MTAVQFSTRVGSFNFNTSVPTVGTVQPTVQFDARDFPRDKAPGI
jgi:hypothetical protein